MNDFVVIPYSGQQVSVLKEVADFLEQDRKREQAQEKQDERHLLQVRDDIPEGGVSGQKN